MPSGISGIVVKKNNKDLGISFLDHPSEDVVYIHNVKGKFRKYTILAPGLRVTHVNGFIVFTAAEARKLIQRTPIGGSVQVIATGKYIELKKQPKRSSIFRTSSSSSRLESASPSSSSSSAPLGIHLRPLPGRLNLVQITKVDNLLTEVPPGHILVAINKRPVRSVRKAHWYLKMLLSSSKRVVKIVTCPVHSFSTVSPGGVMAVVEPIMDHDSVNAFHPDMQLPEEDPFFAPLSSNWNKESSLEQQLCQLDTSFSSSNTNNNESEGVGQQPQYENDTILNQYEDDSLLRQYRVQRQDTGSTESSLIGREDTGGGAIGHALRKKSSILESIATDEHGDYIFEDEQDTNVIIRLPSSLQQSVRSMSTTNTTHQQFSTVSSEAASGLPDMILNLQTQNDLMDDTTMGSVPSRLQSSGGITAREQTSDSTNTTSSTRNNKDDPKVSVPFIFVDSASADSDEVFKQLQQQPTEVEDLQAFLTKEGHLQQPLPPQKNAAAPPAAATVAMKYIAAATKQKNATVQTPLRDSTNNEKKPSPYSPSFFDKQKTSALFQSVEKAKRRSGENNHPKKQDAGFNNKKNKLNRREIPALMDGDLVANNKKKRPTTTTNNNNNNSATTKRTTTNTSSSSFPKRTAKLVDDNVCLPVQIHINNMDNADLQSFLTEEEEEEKVEYDLLLKEIDTDLAAVAPPPPPNNNNNNRATTATPLTSNKSAKSFPFSLPTTTTTSPFQNKGNENMKQTKKNRLEPPHSWCIMSQPTHSFGVRQQSSVEEAKDHHDNEEEEEVVGDTEYYDEEEESLFAKGFHFLQAMAADATACVSPSSRYDYRNMKTKNRHHHNNNTTTTTTTTTTTRQFEVYAV
ncbi:unnamed protein product [Cylindrotheca closterium]|uniref:PDZ domain-containing protein n=1 Tax=Cylindrotheca closterium TaxID=2856 RepID=A0AAD2JG78_9STRA|nr:unnamed protein product [Cylindrotheca closterium]